MIRQMTMGVERDEGCNQWITGIYERENTHELETNQWIYYDYNYKSTADVC